MPAFDTPANSAARELFDEMSRWPIYDPHTHIDPHRPAARHFDEILGYHYYTELAHSAGMPARTVSPDLDRVGARSKPRRIPRSHRLDGPVLVAAGNRTDLSSIFRTIGSRPGTSASCSIARTTSATARTGTARSGRPAGSKPCFSPTTSTTLWTAGTRRLTCRACGLTTWS